MPKIYEYLGILIYFYSREHDPIHIHASSGEKESRAEFFITNGIISEIIITNIRGKKPITGRKLKDFEKFLEVYADAIVQKWIDYFVLNKDVVFEKINKKIK
jgi:hypothetical protein